MNREDRERLDDTMARVKCFACGGVRTLKFVDEPEVGGLRRELGETPGPMTLGCDSCGLIVMFYREKFIERFGRRQT